MNTKYRKENKYKKKSDCFMFQIKTSIVFVMLLHYIFLYNSCGHAILWDIPIHEVRQKLYNSDYSFLKNMDFSNYKLNDVMHLGPDAPYYFYFIFKDYLKNTNNKLAEKMLILTWKKSNSICSSEAGLIYLQNLYTEKKYSDLEKNAKLFLKKTSLKPQKKIAERILVSALFEQEKDKEVLNKLLKYYPSEEQTFKNDPEIILFKAVSMFRLGHPDWQNEFVKLFLKTDSPVIIRRAYNFITQDREKFDALNEDIKTLITLRNLITFEKVSITLPMIEGFIKKIKPSYLSDSSILNELGSMYISAENYEKGAEFILSLSEKLSGKARLKAFEEAGKIQRKNENFLESIKALQIVINETNDPSQKNRSVWFLLSSALKISTDIFLRELEKYSSVWSDPEYFDDILEKGMSSLIAERKWNYVQRLYLLTKETASEKIKSYYSYILARLLKLDYLQAKGKDKEKAIKEYLEYTAQRKNPDYFAFIASLSLKELPEFINNIKESPKKNEKEEKKINTEYDRLIQGFLDYGLVLEAYKMINKNTDSAGKHVIFQTIKKLRRNNFLRQSILLMNTYMKRSDFNLTNEEIKYSYPKAYNNELAEETAKYNIKTALFYALIREESAFNPQALSVTKAAGLTQLMPETASEAAGWLRLADYDLNDPATNIKIGAYHFHRLKRVLNSIPKVLIAYNAGLGRLRYWERSYKGLPDDLFLESLPYMETKDYVRKIIVSTVLYEYIYNSTDPKESFLFFFPELF